MVGLFARRDPWFEDGKGARRDRTRRRLTGGLAFLLAVAACGLTTAAWLRIVLPAMGVASLG
jgi:hypothetical protein